MGLEARLGKLEGKLGADPRGCLYVVVDDDDDLDALALAGLKVYYRDGVSPDDWDEYEVDAST
jgi:hypothetical protein